MIINVSDIRLAMQGLSDNTPLEVVSHPLDPVCIVVEEIGPVNMHSAHPKLRITIRLEKPR